MVSVLYKGKDISVLKLLADKLYSSSGQLRTCKTIYIDVNLGHFLIIS